MLRQVGINNRQSWFDVLSLGRCRDAAVKLFSLHEGRSRRIRLVRLHFHIVIDDCVVVVGDVTADDDVQTDADANNDAGISRNEYLTQQERSEYSAAVDCHEWNKWDEYVTCNDDGMSGLSRQPSGSAETASYTADVLQTARFHKLNDSAVDTDIARSGGGRLSSAMKLKRDVESPRQHETSVQASEHTDSVSFSCVSPPSELQSPVIRSPGVSAAVHDRKSPATNKPSSESSMNRASGNWNRGMLSNEPLGAEFDVKQIKVRRPSSMSPSGEFDFFADMTPVIASSSSVTAQSLLAVLSASAPADDMSAQVPPTQPSSRLDFNNVNHFDSEVSC